MLPSVSSLLFLVPSIPSLVPPVIPLQPDANMDLFIENNIVMGSVTRDYYLIDGPAGTTTSNNNMSADATADDYGGSNHLISKTASNQFVNVSNDWNLLATADALNAGKTMTSFSNDAVHDSGWRPQGAAYDMGALERAATGKRRPPIAAGGRLQCY